MVARYCKIEGTSKTRNVQETFYENGDIFSNLEPAIKKTEEITKRFHSQGSTPQHDGSLPRSLTYIVSHVGRSDSFSIGSLGIRGTHTLPGSGSYFYQTLHFKLTDLMEDFIALILDANPINEEEVYLAKNEGQALMTRTLPSMHEEVTESDRYAVCNAVLGLTDGKKIVVRLERTDNFEERARSILTQIYLLLPLKKRCKIGFTTYRRADDLSDAELVKAVDIFVIEHDAPIPDLPYDKFADIIDLNTMDKKYIQHKFTNAMYEWSTKSNDERQFTSAEMYGDTLEDDFLQLFQLHCQSYEEEPEEAEDEYTQQWQTDKHCVASFNDLVEYYYRFPELETSDTLKACFVDLINTSYITPSLDGKPRSWVHLLKEHYDSYGKEAFDAAVIVSYKEFRCYNNPDLFRGFLLLFKDIVDKESIEGANTMDEASLRQMIYKIMRESGGNEVQIGQAALPQNLDNYDKIASMEREINTLTINLNNIADMMDNPGRQGDITGGMLDGILLDIRADMKKEMFNLREDILGHIFHSDEFNEIKVKLEKLNYIVEQMAAAPRPAAPPPPVASPIVSPTASLPVRTEPLPPPPPPTPEFDDILLALHNALSELEVGDKIQKFATVIKTAGNEVFSECAFILEDMYDDLHEWIVYVKKLSEDKTYYDDRTFEDLNNHVYAFDTSLSPKMGKVLDDIKLYRDEYSIFAAFIEQLKTTSEYLKFLRAKKAVDSLEGGQFAEKHRGVYVDYIKAETFKEVSFTSGRGAVETNTNNANKRITEATKAITAFTEAAEIYLDTIEKMEATDTTKLAAVSEAANRAMNYLDNIRFPDADYKNQKDIIASLVKYFNEPR